MVSTVKAFYDKQYNCYFCKKQPGHPATIRGLREIKGCFDIFDKPGKFDKVAYYTCIGNFYSPQVAQLWELFKNYEKGMMPFPGSYMDQPAKIIDIFQLMDSIRTQEIERKKKEEDEERRSGAAKRN